MVPAKFSAPDMPGRTGRTMMWIMFVVGFIAAGFCFVYKIAEFVFTMGGSEVKGFADVPITVYFAVAGGWLCLLIWCFATGKFANAEQAKFDMIAKEEEYERLGV